MPIRDDTARRNYMRDYMKKRRAGGAAPKQPVSPVKPDLVKPVKPAEPVIDPATLSMTAQQRLEAAIRAHTRKLDAEFAWRVQADIKRLIDEMVLPQYNEEHDHHREIIKSHKGVFDNATYRQILARLHPDTGGTAELFDLFKKLERVLRKPEEKPSNIPPLPKTFEELMAHKRKVDAERKAKRAAARNGATITPVSE